MLFQYLFQFLKIFRRARKIEASSGLPMGLKKPLILTSKQLIKFKISATIFLLSLKISDPISKRYFHDLNLKSLGSLFARYFFISQSSIRISRYFMFSLLGCIKVDLKTSQKNLALLKTSEEIIVSMGKGFIFVRYFLKKQFLLNNNIFNKKNQWHSLNRLFYFLL